MNRRLIAAVCVLMLAAPSPPEQLPPVPGKQLPLAARATRLELSIGGGIFPPNYRVTLQGDELTYWVQSHNPVTNQLVETTKTIKPSPEQWNEFWKAMDEVGLWTWKPVYRDPNILDGTMWGVVAVHDGRSIQSTGGNLYPGQKDPAKPGELRGGYTPLFEKYLAAVRKLLGDLPFS